MKLRNIFIVQLILFLSLNISMGYSMNNSSKNTAIDIKKIIVYKSGKLYFIESYLNMCKLVNNNINKKEYHNSINQMVKEIKKRIEVRNAAKNHLKIIQIINQYLFKDKGYHYFTNTNRLWENYVLMPTVLKYKAGNCMSLSMLYLSITQKLKLPVYGIVVPDHAFIKYKKGKIVINIETTRSGINLKNSLYIKEYKFSNKTKNIYMKELSLYKMLGIYMKSIGNVLLKRKIYIRALKCSNIVIDIDPLYADAWNNKGVVLDKLNNSSAALRCYNKALTINPESPASWNNKGNRLFNLGRLQEAIICFNKALKINPNNSNSWNNKGYILFKMDKLPQAIKACNQAIRKNYKNAYAWGTKGSVLDKLNRLPEAITCFKRALKLDPSIAITWIDKGVTLYKYGNKSAAKNSILRGLSLNQKFMKKVPVKIRKALGL